MIHGGDDEDWDEGGESKHGEKVTAWMERVRRRKWSGSPHASALQGTQDGNRAHLGR